MKFIDRNVPNPNVFRITPADGTESYTALLESDCGEIYEEGTPLDAQTLNAAFDEKQDKLSVERNGKLVLTQNADGKTEIAIDDRRPLDYAPLCREIISSDFIPNYATWTAKPAEGPQMDKFCYMQIGNEAYKSVKAEFDLEINQKNVVDPLTYVGILFLDEQGNGVAIDLNTVSKTADFFKLESNIIQYCFSSAEIKSFFKRVKVVRSTENTAGYTYSLFIDDVLIHKVFEQGKQDYSYVSVGNLGSYVDIRYWKIDGEI